MTRTVRAKAPAKVNLQLTVGPVREDGYHPLVTVFHCGLIAAGFDRTTRQ